jgi:hypothetical protein
MGRDLGIYGLHVTIIIIIIIIIIIMTIIMAPTQWCVAS